MSIYDLITDYETERKQAPESINAILDFYQNKYVNGEIDILEYRSVYHYLHRQGAISAHEFS